MIRYSHNISVPIAPVGIYLAPGCCCSSQSSQLGKTDDWFLLRLNAQHLLALWKLTRNTNALWLKYVVTSALETYCKASNVRSALNWATPRVNPFMNLNRLFVSLCYQVGILLLYYSVTPLKLFFICTYLWSPCSDRFCIRVFVGWEGVGIEIRMRTCKRKRESS